MGPLRRTADLIGSMVVPAMALSICLWSFWGWVPFGVAGALWLVWLVESLDPFRDGR
jgi:hypothetical protein